MGDLHHQLVLFGANELKQKLPREDHKLVDIASAALADPGTELSFLHRGFAQVGLPLRKQADNDKLWVRSDGLFTLTVKGDRFAYDGMREVSVGVPYGTKARLLMVYIASELKDPRRASDNPMIEFGRITEWLRTVGVNPTGGPHGSISAVKEQLFRLAFAQFTMVRRHVDRNEPDQVWFESERLFRGGFFKDTDFDMWNEGRLSKLSWPKGLLLTSNSHERIRSQSIPISTVRLRQIADSAAAMDLFFWLSYRLPRITHGDRITVSWQDLMVQFGQKAPFTSDFRKAIKPALKAALAAYPEANVEESAKGLVLRRSDPAVPPKPRLVQGALLPKKASTT